MSRPNARRTPRFHVPGPLGRERTRLTRLALVLVASAALSALVLPSTAALTGAIGNTSNTTGMGYLSCYYAASGQGASHYYPLNDGSALGGTATDLLGTINGKYQLLSAANGSGGPCAHDSTAQQANNANGYAALNSTLSQWVSTNSAGFAMSNSASQTLQIWFSTSTDQGLMMDVGNMQTSASSVKGESLMMTTTGKVEFATYLSGVNYEIQSTNRYDDGRWHMATGVFTAGGGSALYVDGALVASNSSAQTETVSSLYLHIGWDSCQGWVKSGLSGSTALYFFNGGLARAAVYPKALTAQNIASMYAAATY